MILKKLTFWALTGFLALSHMGVATGQDAAAEADADVAGDDVLQVAIEAEFLEVDDRFLEEIGLDFLAPLEVGDRGEGFAWLGAVDLENREIVRAGVRIQVGDRTQMTNAKGEEPFVRPPGIVEENVCLRSGMLATASCDSTATEVFLPQYFPQDVCDVHGGQLHNFEGVGKDFQTLDSDNDEF